MEKEGSAKSAARGKRRRTHSHTVDKCTRHTLLSTPLGSRARPGGETRATAARGGGAEPTVAHKLGWASFCSTPLRNHGGPRGKGPRASRQGRRAGRRVPAAPPRGAVLLRARPFKSRGLFCCRGSPRGSTRGVGSQRDGIATPRPPAAGRRAAWRGPCQNHHQNCGARAPAGPALAAGRRRPAAARARRSGRLLRGTGRGAPRSTMSTPPRRRRPSGDGPHPPHQCACRPADAKRGRGGLQNLGAAPKARGESFVSQFFEWRRRVWRRLVCCRRALAVYSEPACWQVLEHLGIMCPQAAAFPRESAGGQG